MECFNSYVINPIDHAMNFPVDTTIISDIAHLSEMIECLSSVEEKESDLAIYSRERSHGIDAGVDDSDAGDDVDKSINEEIGERYEF